MTIRRMLVVRSRDSIQNLPCFNVVFLMSLKFIPVTLQYESIATMSQWEEATPILSPFVSSILVQKSGRETNRSHEV